MKHQTENSRATHYSGILYHGSSFSPHFHNSYELIAVLTGDVTVTVNGQRHRLNEKDFFLISPCAAHSITSSEDSDLFISIISPDYVSDFHESHKENISYRFTVSEDAFAFIRAHLIDKSERTRYELKACLYALLSFADAGEKTCASEDKNYSFVYSVNCYITEHFTEPIRRAHLAAATGYEEHYFSGLFKKNFGMSLTRYVNTYRVTHAARLLRTTDAKVCRIALDSGFSSVKEFNNVFRELMSDTPVGYRKSAGELPRTGN